MPPWNPCWAYACYGRKVEQAIGLRKAGSQLLLVHEADFWVIGHEGQATGGSGGAGGWSRSGSRSSARSSDNSIRAWTSRSANGRAKATEP